MGCKVRGEVVEEGCVCVCVCVCTRACVCERGGEREILDIPMDSVFKIWVMITQIQCQN